MSSSDDDDDDDDSSEEEPDVTDLGLYRVGKSM